MLQVRIQNYIEIKAKRERICMGWVTVYIRGKNGFKSDVLHELDRSRVDVLPGNANERGVALYWIPEDLSLRDFKKAIGAKTIFKHRLKFYMTVEEFVENKFNTRAEEFELN
jgi:hypothetical protein